METLIRACLGRARTVISLLVLLMVSGAVAFVEIPKESAPDVNVPIIYVSMIHDGISPEDAARLLLIPMEKELRTVEGVKEMRSTAYEGGANVLLEFEAGFNADLAMQDVRQQVDKAKPKLPESTEEPSVHEVNISLFPIMVVTVSGDVPERTLLTLSNRLKDRIETIPSVLEAKLGGDRDRQMEVVIDPVLVRSYGLSASDFAGFLARNNKLVAAGSLDNGQGRFAIKVPGLLRDVEDVMNLPVKVTGDAVVRLRDIATGRDSFEDAIGLARVNGEPGLTLSVKKRIGTNIIDTVDAVKQVTAEVTAEWPESVQVHFTQDQSEEIRNNLGDLLNNALTAIILVMILIIGEMGVRSGLLVGLAIPGSFLIGVLVLAASGLTVNMVVLFGLILAVGMMVDGAIVIIEYADRLMVEGVHRKPAYVEAARRMAWPVITSTATVLAAFLPMLFWTGMVGEFMKYLPITLLTTLSASLLMALVFLPTLGGLIGKPGDASPEMMKALTESESGDLSSLRGMTGGYVRVLRWALVRPGKVVAASAVVLVLVQVAYWTFGRGVEFFPDVEPERAQILVHARGNLSIAEQGHLVREVEQIVLTRPELSSVYSLIGEGAKGEQDSAADLIGLIGLEFTDWDTRRSASEVLAELRTETEKLAGVEIELRKAEEGPPVGKPIQVELSARDPKTLDNAARQLRAILDQLGGFVDVEDSGNVPGLEWRLTVDRAQAAKFGVNVETVGDMVQMVTRGLKITDYQPDGADKEVNIVVRFPEANRTLDQLDTLFVNTDAGPVPVSGFVTREARPKTGEIHRTDGRPVVMVKADVGPDLLPNDQVQRLTEALEQPGALPPGVSYLFKGEDKEQRESGIFLMKAFAVALFLIAIIMVTQFNSFYSTFLILTAVLMSTIGVFLGLLIFDQPFGIIMCGIAVISLAGIVVSNNIVLIDTYDLLKKEVANVDEAIIRTGAQRLRPVFLTQLTTVLGILPMMFEVNIDFVGRTVFQGAPSAQWWSQLSIATVCGLTFSTALTLVFTPCMLKLKAEWDRKRAERRQRREAPAGAV